MYTIFKVLLLARRFTGRMMRGRKIRIVPGTPELIDETLNHGRSSPSTTAVPTAATPSYYPQNTQVLPQKQISAPLSPSAPAPFTTSATPLALGIPTLGGGLEALLANPTFLASLGTMDLSQQLSFIAALGIGQPLPTITPSPTPALASLLGTSSLTPVMSSTPTPLTASTDAIGNEDIGIEQLLDDPEVSSSDHFQLSLLMIFH